MARGTITLRQRFFKMIAEMIGAVLITIGLSFGVAHILYHQRVINSPAILAQLDTHLIQATPNVDNYLNSLGLHYLIVDEQGADLVNHMTPAQAMVAKGNINQDEIVKTLAEEYHYYRNDNKQIIVRIPLIPEFIKDEWETRLPFNITYNYSTLLVIMIMLFVPVIRFLRQMNREFTQLEAQILSNDSQTPINELPTQIMEVNRAMVQVQQMKHHLVTLLQEEKDHKEDLLFQIAALSHDIKTPLTLIKGNAGLLEYVERADEFTESVNAINQGVDTIETYLDQMIMFARWTGELEERSYFKLSDLICSIHQQIDGHHTDIMIEMTKPHNSQNIVIFGSRINIERAMMNLITNALRYADTFVKIQIMTTECVTIRIKNDGPPIATDLLPHLGKLFYTEDSGRLNQEPHYGLGLYFVSQVAISHGGQLTWANTPDGVEFILTFSTEPESLD